MKSELAVLYVNLGSPDSPEVGDVRNYLREFLLDPRVIDAPWLIRQFVVRGLILPTRPKSSAEAYRSIWTMDGSPLVVTSSKQRAALETACGLPVLLAMRYGKPTIHGALEEALNRGVTKLFVIPAYPHYAMSSYETVVVRVRELAARIAPSIKLVFQPPFYRDPRYIDALVESARPWLVRKYDHLLFSYHGVPERHMRKADRSGKHCLAIPHCCEKADPVHEVCYRAQVRKTTAEFVKKAGVPDSKYSISFQSRLGREPWLSPYTDHVLERLPKAGVKKLFVVCPAFVSDCLETLEEIAERGKETFLHAGGTDFEMIPCLNEHPYWIRALAGFVQDFVDGATPPLVTSCTAQMSS